MAHARISTLGTVALALLFLCAGCASWRSRPPEAGQAPVALTSKDLLYVPAPAVADSVDSLLARKGWGEGRFSRELKKEIAFQFNRKGVATVEDSARANASLALTVADYAEGDGGASRFEVRALLRVPGGERRLVSKKTPGRAEAPERDDPTVDNIRIIAAALVEDARKDPSRKKRKDAPEYTPQMMILF